MQLGIHNSMNCIIPYILFVFRSKLNFILYVYGLASLYVWYKVFDRVLFLYVFNSFDYRWLVPAEDQAQIAYLMYYLLTGIVLFFIPSLFILYINKRYRIKIPINFSVTIILIISIIHIVLVSTLCVLCYRDPNMNRISDFYRSYSVLSQEEILSKIFSDELNEKDKSMLILLLPLTKAVNLNVNSWEEIIKSCKEFDANSSVFVALDIVKKLSKSISYDKIESLPFWSKHRTLESVYYDIYYVYKKSVEIQGHP